MKVAIVVLAILAVASAVPKVSRRSITAAFEDAMTKKIREIANGNEELENTLNEVKKRYVEAFDETLAENFRQVRQALSDRRRSVTDAEYMVRRAFDTMEERVHEKAMRSLLQTRDEQGWWDKFKDYAGKAGDWLKGHFKTFGSWAKEFLAELYTQAKPHLIEVRDMALQLIKDGAAELTQTAKEEAMNFFQENAEDLTQDLKDKIKDTLS